MKKAILVFCIFNYFFVFAQQKYTISGVVKDKNSLETIIGVNIYIPEISKGATTNEYGYYSLTLPEGTYYLSISFLGFKRISKTVKLYSNQRIEFLLEEDTTSLDEIVLKENSSIANISSPEMSVIKMPIQTIKNMPVVLGEVDIIKSIQLLPGVSNAGEGASGFNVRGGAADQNLILLDEATIYNASHLFGFFSVFNVDAIKDIKLYKGGIPAKYGGRVSSVLDVHQKDGNKKDFHINGGIGLISSRLLLEGPLDKNQKSSFLIAGRGSYAHLFLKAANEPNSAYFYDLNTKISYNFDDKNMLFLSGYFGRDIFQISDSFNNSYGNTTLNIRWNHLFNDQIFSNLSLIYSDYNYSLSINSINFDWLSNINNYNLKYDLTYYTGESTKIQFGVNGLYYDFNPGEITSTDESSTVNDEKLDSKYAFESAVYADFEQEISKGFRALLGLRFSMFYRIGEQPVALYKNDQAVIFNENIGIYESALPIGVESYGSGEVIASFNNFEPRIGLSYQFNSNSSFKASYNKMTQYIHLISNTSSPTPLDVWAPSGKYILPQLLDQFSMGYFTNFKENKFTLETEIFYKKIKNRLDYIDGANLIANNNIETEILSGDARSYGFEFLIKKNLGKFTGWLAYTLSRSEQRVIGRTPIETGINNGNWYKTGYDKLHDISLVGQYSFSRKWNFGANFVYQTGRATTYPTGYYAYEGLNIPLYTGRNENNLPSYHHLDISATLYPNQKKGSKWESEWVFSIYNIYARKNAASITFKQSDETLQNEAVKLSIFGIVPSVSYNFKF